MMCTGDFHHTAIAVAKQVGMVTASSDVMIIDTRRQRQLLAQQSQACQAADVPSTSHAAVAPPSTPELSPQSSQRLSERDFPAISRLLSTCTSDDESLRAHLMDLERVTNQDSSTAGLRFVSSESNQELEQSEALAALAEGRAQCAVTGSAFASLLQLQDLSLLEVVVRNAIVFARMQPFQKGESIGK